MMRQNTQKNIFRLYAVTDGDATGCDELSAALIGGVTSVQLREKGLPRAAFLEKGIRFRYLCAAAGVPLIINDSVEIAAESGAAGVHLGQTDLDVVAARTILGPDALIGVSAHSVAEARHAEESGANYLGVGAIFPTSTKPNTVNVSLATLTEICEAVSIPVVAIGGIHRENFSPLLTTGIAGIAVVSDLFRAANTTDITADITAAATEWLRLTAPLG